MGTIIRGYKKQIEQLKKENVELRETIKLGCEFKSLWLGDVSYSKLNKAKESFFNALKEFEL